jgi:hypothetical protein
MKERTRQHLMRKWLKYAAFFRMFTARPTSADLNGVHNDLVTALLQRAHGTKKELWKLPKSEWLTATRQAREFLEERGYHPY